MVRVIRIWVTPALFLLQHKETVNADNCARYKPEELELPGDVSYGVEKQLSYQARTALRLSHFLSNFLQVRAPIR